MAAIRIPEPASSSVAGSGTGVLVVVFDPGTHHSSNPAWDWYFCFAPLPQSSEAVNVPPQPNSE